MPVPSQTQPARLRWYRALHAMAALLAVALLNACSTPRAPPAPLPPVRSPAPTQAPVPGPSSPDRDGPGPVTPPDLQAVPDAEPRIEPARAGGPNKPYEVLGQAHVPLLGDLPVVERGLASWYGRKFHGKRTANGEVYDMYAMTAAHKTMPLPSYARVRNPANGREVVVRINDRGPFHADRVIDLSYTAALKLGLLGGVAPVELERITNEAIRTGSWRRPGGDTALAGAPRPLAAEGDPIGDIARRVAAGPLVASPVVGDVPTMQAGPDATQPSPPPSRTPTAMPSGYWLQLAAFRDAAAAEDWRRQLLQQAEWLAPWLAVLADTSWHRVQAGPYANRSAAQSASERLKSDLRLTPMVIERR